MSHRTVYEAAQQRIGSLVNEGNGDIDVPTCPGWTVKDVVAHLSGSLHSYIKGRLEGASSPEWGNRHVKERGGMSLEQCLAEWDEFMAASGDVFESRLGAVAAADVLAHEHDLRTALNRPGHRNEEGIASAVRMAVAFTDQKLQATNLPAFRIVTEDIDQVVGNGAPVATLRTSTFELFRAMHGRRTPDQVRALDWDGDPTPWMDVFFLFGAGREGRSGVVDRVEPPAQGGTGGS